MGNVEFIERAGDPMPNCADLPVGPAAPKFDRYVEPAERVGRYQRFQDGATVGLQREPILKRFTIDDEYSRITKRDPHACNRSLAAARGLVEVLARCRHGLIFGVRFHFVGARIR